MTYFFNMLMTVLIAVFGVIGLITWAIAPEVALATAQEWYPYAIAFGMVNIIAHQIEAIRG